MTEKERFIETFVANFLSSWCALNYEDCCMRSKHELLYKPPVEDAYDIAEKVWEHKEDLKC